MSERRVIERHPDVMTRKEVAAAIGCKPGQLNRRWGPPSIQGGPIWHRAVVGKWLELNPGVKSPGSTRDEFIARLGGECVVCGSKERLEFDHINPETKIDVVSFKWARWRIEQEVAKCQLLCRPCHQRKSAHESRKRHGLASADEWTSMARHLSRCRECALAILSHMKGRQ